MGGMAMKKRAMLAVAAALCLISTPIMAQDTEDDDGPISADLLLILGGIGAALTAFVAVIDGDEDPVSP